MEELSFGGYRMPHIRTAVAIVGTGAAGYNAADSLYEMGVRDILLVTEGRFMGTSRNTGSDKQTYYKLNMAGGVPDSVYDMARSLMRGGSMHGDIALSDAALSARCFYKLVNLGVPFPMNEYGEYVGYMTDHDATTRATSCGPLTSKFMTEALEKAVLTKHIPVADGHRVWKILTENGAACGLMTVCRSLISPENPAGIAVITAGDIIYAVGGPSAIYADTVYPESQTSGLGAAFEAGVAGANLTESQYGLASILFRWNLSGTYQQVLPRYVSTDSSGGDEREFLADVFSSPGEMLSAIFSKGYEWPFDPKKTAEGGSSRIDLAVYRERARGRRVFLDYRRNPSCADHNGVFDFSCLSGRAKEYLEKSGALLPTPIERLEKMNAPAIALYAAHGIDLRRERLEIAVCAQHCNGGLAVKTSRESTTLSHFYAVGECAGTFGVYRPGGSALNATQTGSLFAAMAIVRNGAALPDVLSESLRTEIEEYAEWAAAFIGGTVHREEILHRRTVYGCRMSECAAFLRKRHAIEETIEKCREELASFENENRPMCAEDLPDVLINRDILLTQLVMLSAIRDYMTDGGMSRGSYLIVNDDVPLFTQMPELDAHHADFVQNVLLCKDGSVQSVFEPVRPLPESEQWFETVWKRYRDEYKID